VRDKTIGLSGKDLKRKRVLADDELRDVWQAAAGQGYPYGNLVQLLMLTGQRLNDVACARRAEIDLKRGVLMVPPERYKTGVAQEVPLTPKAVELFRASMKFGESFVFSTTGGARPISGLSKMKERLDQAIARRREEVGAGPMPAWVLHDLRRTLRTRLTSDIDVDAFIAERVIGHALPGLHGVYDQGAHRDQKRRALEKWEARLLSIVEPKASLPPAQEQANVVRADEVERARKRRRSA